MDTSIWGAIGAVIGLCIVGYLLFQELRNPVLYVVLSQSMMDRLEELRKKNQLKNRSEVIWYAIKMLSVINRMRDQGYQWELTLPQAAEPHEVANVKEQVGQRSGRHILGVRFDKATRLRLEELRITYELKDVYGVITHAVCLFSYLEHEKEQGRHIQLVRTQHVSDDLI